MKDRYNVNSRKFSIAPDEYKSYFWRVGLFQAIVLKCTAIVESGQLCTTLDDKAVQINGPKLAGAQ